MQYKLIKNYLSNESILFYERFNNGWKAKNDGLLVKFEDGTYFTYVIFEGPFTKYNMCRDTGTCYELSLRTKNIKIPYIDVK